MYDSDVLIALQGATEEIEREESEVPVKDIVELRKHAEAGDILAQYHLALLLDVGKWTRRNPLEALKWYKRAAENGYVKAQYFLARMYEAQESGIPQNLAAARQWYQKAAGMGHRGAKERLAQLDEACT